MKMTEWENHYAKWNQEAKQEFVESEHWEDNMKHDFEVTEAGDVHLNNFHVIKSVVTAWKDSRHALSRVIH